MTEATMSPRQRRLRNYLLDAPLQLRFTSVLLLGTLLGAGLLGVFLARALNRLADQAERAVSKTLLERFGDPQFTAQMERQSRAIDAAYVAEQAQVAEQRLEVQREQRRIGWLVLLSVGLFSLGVLALGIVLTHRIAGPVFRVRRLLADLKEGRREVPSHGLRDGDELRELFEAASTLVRTLRAEDEATLATVSEVLRAGGPGVERLRPLQERLAARVG
jgi:hypothetical protein